MGITGTNGKTTTATLIGHLLAAAGWRVATVTTVETLISQRTDPARELGTVLRAAAGCRAVVQETTSFALQRGLAQRDPFDAAVFTNLTHDHLDQHGGSYERYLAAKAQLFTSLARSPNPHPVAVLNGDQAASALLGLVLDPRVRQVTFGWGDGPGREHLRGGWVDGQLTADGIPVRSALVGHHMAENVLAALALVRALGVPLREAAAAVETFAPVRGRFEIVGRRPTVVVDYAHTPDALERTLVAARSLTRGRVWVVFGCGGGRDAAKRAVMGEIAARLADRVVVTTDNPRREDPAAIAAQVLAGTGDRPVRVLDDRAEAIRHAILDADDEDLVLIAGKGHETTQELATGMVAFDDREIAVRALSGRTTIRLEEETHGTQSGPVPGRDGRDGHGLRAHHHQQRM